MKALYRTAAVLLLLFAIPHTFAFQHDCWGEVKARYR